MGCRFHRRASSADKVKLLSPHDRFVIALHSPDRVVETGLLGCPPEKKAAKLAGSNEQDTFSGPVCARELRNCGDFLGFSEECSRVSLQSRLRGGARGIRTLGTVSETSKSLYRGSCIHHRSAALGGTIFRSPRVTSGGFEGP